MNVLITSAGRRSALVEHFRRAASERGGRVIAVDTNGLAHGLYAADVAVRVPPIDHDSFIPGLIGVIRSNDVRVIIPTTDTELPVLAQAAESLLASGAVVVLSDVGFIDAMTDKVATARLFRRCNVRIVRTWLPGHLPGHLPDELFVKPRFGVPASIPTPSNALRSRRSCPWCPIPSYNRFSKTKKSRSTACSIYTESPFTTCPGHVFESGR